MAKVNTTGLLETSDHRGEATGWIEIESASITKLGRVGNRTSIDYGGGLVYVTDPDRKIEARIHRLIADVLDEAAIEAADAAKKEHRIS
jgi:hypothetical protein